LLNGPLAAAQHNPEVDGVYVLSPQEFIFHFSFQELSALVLVRKFSLVLKVGGLLLLEKGGQEEGVVVERDDSKDKERANHAQRVIQAADVAKKLEEGVSFTIVLDDVET